MTTQTVVRKPEDHSEQLVRPREVAARLGVSTNTIYNWCRSGYLGSVKIGRSVRIPASELDAFIARSKAWT
jgi:excisionase family DNA binding protein